MLGCCVTNWTMTGFPLLPPADVAWLLARCRNALEQVAPRYGAWSSRLLAAHSPQQWPVEWNLPWWLAGDLGLPDDAWRDLTVCNLLGLGYVRLQDHLVEQTAASGLSPGRLAVLAGVFHEAALAGLAGVFAETPAFWQHRHTFMAQWLAALPEDDAALHGAGDRWPEEAVLRLGWRGAPLKITAVGACLLAGRTAAIPTLAGALDHLLAAQVLLDHVDDWRDDVDGGRFNAFVAYAAGASRPSSASEYQEAVHSVQALLMTGDPAGYFGHIQRHLARAWALAAAVPCSGLVDFIATLEVDARVGCDELIGAARSQFAGAVANVLLRPRRKSPAPVPIHQGG